ncbi:NDR1/HIN1-like protein 26 [Cryptomeria japonica]|uniref:NDR1/HIN1-like protein 26 n=1 Tax=Cryptomeria japonica TaxID=3369 RepID=UPI0025ABA53D|nr:NDR1/HIN1-like protein 26 [Cryptomeria japonica]
MYKSCRYHEYKFLVIRLRCPENKYWRRLCIGLLVFIPVVLFIILVIYLALRPHKPQFSVQDAIIYKWNVTDDDARALTSSLQFTVISHNPNDKIGVYYDRISAYATYQTQQITQTIWLTPFYQDHHDTTTIPAVFNGTVSPLAPLVADNWRAELQQTGVLHVNLRIGGRIRWKVGTWTSGHYHLNVNCFAIMGFTSNGNRGPLEERTSCDVSV